MHREISHADEAFGRDRNLSLYLLTTLLAVLLVLDLWPAFAEASWASGLGLPSWPRAVSGYRIALLAAILGGARTLYGSLESLLEGRLGADLALALACIAAILIGEPLVAAEVVFIGMLGECLESFTFERTRHALAKIAEVCPRRCWLLRDGQEVRVRVEEVRAGDRVAVKPGARVPVDGRVVDGRSSLDTSTLTGESLPVEKGPGDEVLAGSLNGVGTLTVEAHRVAEHTVVGQVIELTARSLKDKAPLERTADRLARYFLPIVLALAALTFVGGLLIYGTTLFRSADARLSLAQAARLSAYPALAVLVVSCPCALILATPAAIIAALGRLAGTGVLIKGGSALERLAGVSAFAFDKTGTLTEGRLQLGDVVPLEGTTREELLRAAATAEQGSEHALARVVLDAARIGGLTLDPVAEFVAHPGLGVTARTASGTLVVGTPRHLEENGIVLPPAAVEALDCLDADGQTTLLVARDTRVLGLVAARDTVRPQAAAVVAELRALGIDRIALLTGDRPAAAGFVAAATGIPEIHAGLLPAQKADWIATEGSAGRRTAFVGDGINDAPALARAAVGVALGSGTDVAAEAGDIVLMTDPLRPLPLLLKLSRETVRVIRQNILVFALGVNVVGVVVTAWLWPLLAPAGWYEQAPVVAVIYHQFGSLAVLLNSMRLLWFAREAGPSVRRGRQWLHAVDHWMETHLDPGEALHILSHHGRFVTAVVALLLFIGYALSGLTVVKADEVAFIRRWGRLLDEPCGPGLHVRWPWPVEQVVRVQPGHVQTVEVGFRSLPGAAAAENLTWASAHGDAIMRAPDEAVMITGDGNLIEVQATVRYTLSDPRVFLFQAKDPEALLRSAAESVLRDAVSSRAFQDLLTTERDAFQREVSKRLVDRCASYEGGLGLRLEGVALYDMHPPQEVVRSYHDVARAIEGRDRRVNEAMADALRTEREAESKAASTTRFAVADGDAKVKQADTERRLFLARVAVRNQLSVADEWALLRRTASAIRDGQPPADAWRDHGRLRRQRLAAQAALTDFRLFWDALSRSLVGRDKLLIDADNVPGKRHFLLFDLDQMRLPASLLTPTGREESPRGDH